MKNVKKILVVLDGETATHDNKALICAKTLALANQASLDLIDVVSAPPAAVKMYHGILNAEDITELLKEKRAANLQSLSKALTDDGLTVTTEVLEGRDFIEIIRRVLRDEHDIVVKSANRAAHSFDSSDFHLIRKCPRPVWLVKDSQPVIGDNIAACVDLMQEGTEEGRQLNRLILTLATGLAALVNKNVQVVTCWALYGESMFRNNVSLGMTAGKLDKLLVKTEQARREALETLLEEFSDKPTVSHLIKGQAIECLPAFMHEHDIHTVVMGTVGRTGLPGLLIGNTSETVLQQIDSSAITVKPDGFETPVK